MILNDAFPVYCFYFGVSIMCLTTFGSFPHFASSAIGTKQKLEYQLTTTRGAPLFIVPITAACANPAFLKADNT